MLVVKCARKLGFPTLSLLIQAVKEWLKEGFCVGPSLDAALSVSRADGMLWRENIIDTKGAVNGTVFGRSCWLDKSSCFGHRI